MREDRKYHNHDRRSGIRIYNLYEDPTYVRHLKVLRREAICPRVSQNYAASRQSREKS